MVCFYHEGGEQHPTIEAGKFLMLTIFLVLSNIVDIFLAPPTLLRSLRLNSVTEVPQPLPDLIVVNSSVLCWGLDDLLSIVEELSVAFPLLLFLGPLLIRYSYSYRNITQVRRTFNIFFIREKLFQVIRSLLRFVFFGRTGMFGKSFKFFLAIWASFLFSLTLWGFGGW